MTVHTAMSGCDCSLQPVDRLTPVDEALDKALAVAGQVQDTEDVPLDRLKGRVLAADVHAPIDLPTFRNAAMDGYAVRTADLTGQGPWTLQVTGRIACGDDTGPLPALSPGDCMRVFTGSGLPDGADAVIMQEQVDRFADTIRLNKPVASGRNVRRQGEDAARGSLLVPAETCIGTREIAAISAVGIESAPVVRRLKVAILCSGSELRQPGEPLAPGQIYNSNRFMLHAALDAPWIEVLDFGALPDDPGRLRRALEDAAAGADLLLTTGGVSVGEEDHMVAQFQAAGGTVEVMKLAMKPGKPLTIGTLGTSVFLGLPGNPVAAYTTWSVVGHPVARKMAGMFNPTPRAVHVRAAEGFRRHPGRREYRPVRYINPCDKTDSRVEFLDHSFSAKVALLCRADGFAIIPADTTEIAPGDPFEFVPFHQPGE